MIKSYLKVIAENAQTLQKLADSEAQEDTEESTDLDEPSSSQDDQSIQSTSE